MSRAARITFGVSTLAALTTVWGVHYLQRKERETMFRGVQRDAERQAEKRRQRAVDLEANRESERSLVAMQPSATSPAPSKDEGGATPAALPSEGAQTSKPIAETGAASAGTDAPNGAPAFGPWGTKRTASAIYFETHRI